MHGNVDDEDTAGEGTVSGGMADEATIKWEQEIVPVGSSGGSDDSPKEAFQTWADTLSDLDNELNTTARLADQLMRASPHLKRLNSIERNVDDRAVQSILNDWDERTGLGELTNPNLTEVDEYKKKLFQEYKITDRLAQLKTFNLKADKVDRRLQRPYSLSYAPNLWTFVKSMSAVSSYETQLKNKAIISDEEVRQCRIMNGVVCLQYGNVRDREDGPPRDGLLLIIRHSLQPLNTVRIKSAEVKVRLPGASIVLLEPRSIEDSETSGTRTGTLTGAFTIGYPKLPASLSITGERGHTDDLKLFRHIDGAGDPGDCATYTLRENERAQSGVHHEFCSVLLVKRDKSLPTVLIQTEVEGRLGKLIGGRSFISSGSRELSRKNYGFRPDGFTINEKRFEKVAVARP